MPKISKKAMALKNITRDANGKFSGSTSDSTLEGWQVWDQDSQTVAVIDQQTPDLEAGSSQRNMSDVIKDDGNHGRKRGFYQNNSITTKWRRAAEAKAVNPKHQLTNFGFVVGSNKIKVSEKRLTGKQLEVIQIKNCYDDLLKCTRPVMNMQHEGGTVESYQYARYLSIHRYCLNRLDGYE